MSKKLIQILLVSTLLLTGCSKYKNDDKIKVSATLFPAYDYVREIAGEDVDLELILKPGTDLHTFDPTPQDIVNIQKSDLFIYIGVEKWADSIIKGLDTNKTKVIRLMDYVELEEELITEGMEHSHEGHDHEHEDESHEHEDHEHEDHDHEINNSEMDMNDLLAYDEHIWTSLKNAEILVEEITEVLVDIDKSNKDKFTSNSEKYINKLDELDDDFEHMIENSKRKEILVGDRFPFTYFVEDYDLEAYAAFTGCSSSTNASPQTITFLINKMKENNIPVVFYIELSNQKIADTIIEGTNNKKLELNSAHNLTKKQFDDGLTYYDFMKNNYKNLESALN